MRKEAEEEEQNASLVYSPGRNGRAVIRVGEQFGGGAGGELQLDTFEVHSTPILKCRHEEVPLFFFKFVNIFVNRYYYQHSIRSY